MEKEAIFIDMTKKGQDNLKIDHRSVVGWMRVSTRDQKRGYSIEGQKETIIEYANENGVVISEFYEEAKSAYKENVKRREYERLIQNIKANKIKLIVVWKSDRLNRRVSEQEKMFKLLEKMNVKLMSLTENIDYSNAAGRYSTRQQNVTNQYESEKTSERTILGMKASARSKNYPISKIPFGYQKKFNQASSPIVPIEEHVELVVNLFNKIAIDRWGIKKLLYWLNHTEEYRQIKYWTETTLYDLLKNPIYYGTLRIPRKNPRFVVENHSPPIISKEVFEKVQAIITSRSGNHKSLYRLKNYVVCSDCDAIMVCWSTNKKGTIYLYYYCSTCKRRINEKKLLVMLSSSYYDIVSTADENLLREQYKKRIDRLNKLKDAYDAYYVDGLMTLTEHEANITRILNEHTAITKMLTNIENNHSEPFYSLEYSEVRNFLSDCIQLIHYSPDNQNAKFILKNARNEI